MSKQKYMVRFMRPSTGYVPGSIPPRFEKSEVKLVDALGSDGQMQIDGRLRLSNKITLANDLARVRGFAGFRIFREPSRRCFSVPQAVTGVMETQ